ncbi:hemolysin III family protein [Candidatus Saccharibacteria bacterium]|jgi:channel protein (hemolysin III family)|nr:hemolysin III family protein [Candidatus Saccharibacteria bacterium]
MTKKTKQEKARRLKLQKRISIIPASTLLVMLAWLAAQNNRWFVTGILLLLITVLILYITSAIAVFLYLDSKRKRTLNRIDYTTVSIFLIGTYYSIFRLIPKNYPALIMLFVSLCVVITVKYRRTKNASLFNTVTTAAIYTAAGWLSALGLIKLYQSLSSVDFGLLTAGLVVYAAVTSLYILDRRGFSLLPWLSWRELLHYFIIGGTVAHVVLLVRLITG